MRKSGTRERWDKPPAPHVPILTSLVFRCAIGMHVGTSRTTSCIPWTKEGPKTLNNAEVDAYG